MLFTILYSPVNSKHATPQVNSTRYFHISNSGQMGVCQFFEHKSVHKNIKIVTEVDDNIIHVLLLPKEQMVTKNDSDIKHWNLRVSF